MTMTPLEPTSLQVECFAQGSNALIVRTPGRRFPAVVVQGDSLHNLFVLAQSVAQQVRSGTVSESLQEDAEELRDLLWDRLHLYEETLRAHGLELPYSRAGRPA